MSNDGSQLVASSYTSTAYSSKDFGVTWNSNEVIKSGYGVAASADGSKFAVTAFEGVFTFGSPATVPKAANATVTITKISTNSYEITVKSSSPNTRYTINLTNENGQIGCYSGHTISTGGVIIKVKENLGGFSATVKIGS